ncbi:hypothetical protein A5787_09745 [Mycobacterium sp. 852002-50816_SCH5313054-b]|uniref:hypothetical protein n=1 Tax=Mycobacterium sp. 852002-50816_SCH5313054-b TaxID=1834092 RepID=UPI0007FEBB6C|nr:hypothetical protein [Mycobacterium sp. 852002-50816_SCH5313054-b]OBF48589.1 hypothetical protein A5787_09745 [Mycobacterium sp. 852002-50816_SCH5313054-b]
MRWSAIVACVVLLLISIGGIAVAGFYDSLFSNHHGDNNDESDSAYRAYGELPIPGSQTLHLPAGQVAITFHAQTASGSDGPLSIPDLQLNIVPPAGVAEPKVTESPGGTTSIDNDSRRQVWVAQIPQDGHYEITADGQVGAFISARLAFGHVAVGSSSSRIPGWVRPGAGVFAALAVCAFVLVVNREREHKLAWGNMPPPLPAQQPVQPFLARGRPYPPSTERAGIEMPKTRRDRLEDMMRLRVEAGVSLGRARAEVVLGQALRAILAAGIVVLALGLVGAGVAPSGGLGRLVSIGLALSGVAAVLLVVRGLYSLHVVRKVRWQDGTVTIRRVQPGQVGENGQHVVCDVELKPNMPAVYQAGPNPTAQIIRVATTVGPLDSQWLVVGATMRCRIDRAEFEYLLRAFPYAAPNASIPSGRNLTFKRA